MFASGQVPFVYAFLTGEREMSEVHRVELEQRMMGEVKIPCMQ